VGAAPLLWGGGYWGTQASPSSPYRVRVEQNIPEGAVALEEGARVLGSDYVIREIR
jgi:hypothetical protein